MCRWQQDHHLPHLRKVGMLPFLVRSTVHAKGTARRNQAPEIPGSDQVGKHQPLTVKLVEFVTCEASHEGLTCKLS